MDQDWASLFEYKDMEESWTIFISKVKQAVSASTPFVKILRGKKANLPLKTQAVALIKSKKEAWTKLKDNWSKTNWENYRKPKNKVRKRTREEIESRENEITKASKSNRNFFWNYVEQKTKRTESIPNLPKEDGELTVSDQEKAEVLSQILSSILMHEEHGNSNIPIKTYCEMSDMYFEESKLLKDLEL